MFDFKKNIRKSFVYKFNFIYFNNSASTVKFRYNIFFKFNGLVQFWLIFQYLRFCSRHCCFIRKRFFKGDYRHSIFFLKYCVFYTTDFELALDLVNYFREHNDDVVSRLQFLFLLNKYIYSDVNSCLVNIDDWDDEEYDWIISVLVQINYNRVFHYVPSYFKISKLRWWEKVNPFFIFYYNGPFKNISKNAYKLGFDFGRKFNFFQSEFQNWRSGVVPSFNSLSINKRFLLSFQAQFNYSDFPVFFSHLSNFRYIQNFHPIFPEMYDLPFLNPALRPGFTNYTEMHFMSLTQTLNFAGLYHLKAGDFDRFVFDRYLYDYARMMIALPYRYSALVESKYTINFGSVIRSSYFFCYFNHFSGGFALEFTNFIVSGPQVFEILPYYFRNLNDYEISNYCFRSRYVSEIITKFWKLLVHLQKYFEFINFFYETSVDHSFNGYDYPYDWVNDFSGVFKPESFDRITRRFFIEFSKFLYSRSKLELNIIFKFIEDLQFLMNSELIGWNIAEIGYSNTMTEFETGYRGRLSDKFSSQNSFDNWFYESMELFYDYELWLYYIFQVLKKFLDEILKFLDKLGVMVKILLRVFIVFFY